MSQNKILVRPATNDDMQTLLRFEQGVIATERPFDPTLKPDPIHYYNLNHLISAEHICLLVAEVDGAIVGSGYARIEPAAHHFLDYKEHAYMGFMYTEPPHRGKGINRLIIEALTTWVVRKGVKECRLEVYAGNAAAINAYRKAGFSDLLIEMRMGLDEV